VLKKKCRQESRTLVNLKLQEFRVCHAGGFFLNPLAAI
jgi:hypothetical protein